MSPYRRVFLSAIANPDGINLLSSSKVRFSHLHSLGPSSGLKNGVQFAPAVLLDVSWATRVRKRDRRTGPRTREGLAVRPVLRQVPRDDVDLVAFPSECEGGGESDDCGQGGREKAIKSGGDEERDLAYHQLRGRLRGRQTWLVW